MPRIKSSILSWYGMLIALFSIAMIASLQIKILHSKI